MLLALVKPLILLSLCVKHRLLAHKGLTAHRANGGGERRGQKCLFYGQEAALSRVSIPEECLVKVITRCRIGGANALGNVQSLCHTGSKERVVQGVVGREIHFDPEMLHRVFKRSLSLLAVRFAVEHGLHIVVFV